MRGNFWFVVGVAQLGLDVEFEVGIVVDFFVAKLNHKSLATSDGRAHQHWLEHRVNVFTDIFDHDGLTIGNRHLNRIQVFVLSKLYGLHLLCGSLGRVRLKCTIFLFVPILRLLLLHDLSVLPAQPLDTLQLWVNE